MTVGLRIAATGLVLFAFAGVPASGQRTELGMLDQLQSGSWEIRQRGPDGRIERLCLRDGRRLIQLRHRHAHCVRQVIADTPSEVAVQYTCHGNGYGLTRIRKETSQLVQIESQGVANAQPFSFSAEGRHVGDCTG